MNFYVCDVVTTSDPEQLAADGLDFCLSHTYPIIRGRGDFSADISEGDAWALVKSSANINGVQGIDKLPNVPPQASEVVISAFENILLAKGLVIEDERKKPAYASALRMLDI